MTHRPTFALTAALLAAACGGSQAGAGYPGEPLAELGGHVDGSDPMPPHDVRLVWQLGAPPSMDEPRFGWQANIFATDVSSSRTDFVVSITYPPALDDFVQLAANELPFARASAAAVPAGTTDELLALLPGSENPAYGLDAGHWIIYLPFPASSGTLTSWWLGGALGSGYHLVSVSAAPCLTEAELARCVTDLRGFGAPDDPTASDLCLAPYRLSPASKSEELHITLGVEAPQPRTCP
jgi:hypothetical protein